MMEILSESVRLANLPFTVLLGCVILYWLIMCLGLINFDTGADADVDADVHLDTGVDTHVDVDGGVDTDVHVDADADADTDVHVDGDSDADVHGGHAEPGWFSPLFQFLNVGEVPLMVVLSVMALSLWIISLILNHYWNPVGSMVLMLLFLVPNLVATCVVTHFISRPFKVLFKALNKEYDEHLPIVGRTCTITTSHADTEFGQAQIETKGAPIVINVRTSGDAVLNKGDTGLVIKEDKQKSIYTIVKVTAEKLET